MKENSNDFEKEFSQERFKLISRKNSFFVFWNISTTKPLCQKIQTTTMLSLKKTLDFMVFSWNWSKHVGYGLGIQWEHNLKKKKMNLFNKPTIQLMWTNYVYTLSRMWTRIDNYKKSSDLCTYFTKFFRDVIMNDFTKNSTFRKRSEFW